MDKEHIMSPNSAREEGLIMEINRLFLHPRGLALGVDVEHDTLVLYDVREDPEGIYFDPLEWTQHDKDRAKKLDEEFNNRCSIRSEALGYIIQPIVLP